MKSEKIENNGIQLAAVKYFLICLLFLPFLCAGQQQNRSGKPEVWTKEKANNWYKRQGWLVGSNFTPAYAINQLEFWQQPTFNAKEIEKELGWAQGLGMNTMRVFLHDLLHEQDSMGFYRRIDVFLGIASRYKIKPMFVLFDSCWDPFPKSGKQRDPKPFVHNSGWLQSPGAAAIADSTQHQRLQRYVNGVVRKFRADQRILAWDVWNEPDNLNTNSYGKVELLDKANLVLPLLKKTFDWVRSAGPSQPVTSAVWAGDWSSPGSLKPLERLQIEASDIITFHNYGDGAEFGKCIKLLQQYGRPILCTEYMARPNRSTFESCLPLAKKYNVGMYNWGFVDGKTQTIYPWDSWEKDYSAEPPLWFHDVLRGDGTPYNKIETDLIRTLTVKANEQ